MAKVLTVDWGKMEVTRLLGGKSEKVKAQEGPKGLIIGKFSDMVETTEFPNLMLALPTQKKPAAEGVALPPSDSEVEEGESEDDPEVTKKPASAMKSASVKKSAVLKKPASATSKQAWVPTIGCKMNVRALALSCGGWVGCEGGGWTKDDLLRVHNCINSVLY